MQAAMVFGRIYMSKAVKGLIVRKFRNNSLLFLELLKKFGPRTKAISNDFCLYEVLQVTYQYPFL